MAVLNQVFLLFSKDQKSRLAFEFCGNESSYELSVEWGKDETAFFVGKAASTCINMKYNITNGMERFAVMTFSKLVWVGLKRTIGFN